MLKKLSSQLRRELAIDIRESRRIERMVVAKRPDLKERRDRSATVYIDHLQGIRATLDYAATLPSKKVVDLGAGTARALGEIAANEKRLALEFLATGLIYEPEARKNIGSGNYRLTSAETMKGFLAESVGCFLSVYGPFLYSNHLDLVCNRIDEILIPGGIIKLCGMKFVPTSSQELNAKYHSICLYLETFQRTTVRARL